MIETREKFKKCHFFLAKMQPAPVEAQYFSSRDVREIVSWFFATLQSVHPTDQKTGATQVLRAVQVLKSRLDHSAEALRFLYVGNEGFEPPRPLATFMRHYLNGTYARHQAEEALQELETGIRRHYFQEKIPFDDPDTLPKSIFFDASLSGGESAGIKELKKGLEKIVREYDAKEDAPKKAEEIYTAARNNPADVIDFDKIMESAATIIARSTYLNLTLSIGTRDPTSRELAVKYADGLEMAARKLGIDHQLVLEIRDRIFEERERPDVYKKELDAYKTIFRKLVL